MPESPTITPDVIETKQKNDDDVADEAWRLVAILFLCTTIVCIIIGNGNSAIAASIIFATSIYAYEHRI